MWKFRSPYLGMATVAARAALPIPTSVCSIFMCPNSIMAVSFGIFNACTGVDACDCTQGLYKHHKRVCAESRLREKNLMPHQRIKPASVLNRVC